MKLFLLALFFAASACVYGDEPTDTRQLLEELALERSSDEDALLEQLIDSGDAFIKDFVEAWRTGEVYSVTDGQDRIRAVQRVSEAYRYVGSGKAVVLTPEEEETLEKLRPSRKLRRSLARVIDTIDLASKSVDTRIGAAIKLGQSQNPAYLPDLRERLENERSARARLAFEEAINISLLANAADAEELRAAVARLGEIKSVRARDQILRLRDEAAQEGDEELLAIATEASVRIAEHEKFIRHAGSFFRGLSTGSVLLMVAFGLAITFGLMGIINMAHGEFIAIGGYTCFVVQNVFLDAFGPQSQAFQWYFWVSLPISFILAGGIGYVLEKGFVRFLYKRPLESLLATWGLSMVMRQTYRLVFGAANVQVRTPELLSGNYEYAGMSMSYARIFVIGFALFVCVLTWVLLTKTNLGLYIRAVMQNRRMALAIGIPVGRVNSLTFSFGCGLAALAGAALTQLGNVGPNMGQTYIVDSFMVVVAGGVGNLLGAGISAMGIGTVDQFLQPVFGPVMGKIAVLVAIILFLQWKPGGLFPTRSRSMED